MQIAVLGYGVVGSGVVELFEKHKQGIISKSTQNNLDLKYILEIRDCTDSPYSPLFTKDFNDILNDDGVKIVVETMGGLHPAYDYVKASLHAGKHVVSSNKELVATFGYELLKLADKNNVNFLFEASVGGGIPIIRPISQCLAANEINEIAGILNGTTNFILTKMFGESMSFKDALLLAQENGYAERDPSADIDGIDSCRKICILASLCFGSHVFPKDTFTEGISSIKSEDVEYAKSWGGAIKLIAKAKKLENGKIHILVSPALVQNHSQIAHVDDVFNAILVRGDAIGEVVFYGRGAGKMPTASAVLADIIDCAKHDLRKKLFGWGAPVDDYVEDYMDMPVSLYVRAQIGDFLSALAHVEDVITGVTILKRKDAPGDELAFVTPPEKEGLLRQKLKKLPLNPLSIIRVTDY
ncbi:MAG: Homoserine dehydrogenase [Firmicutes bacterium ADurb.Bin300]|nr:MAG: Homoserine dehydrogenase [Firmicutes bacterium ADurb.Bin300]